VKIETKFFYLSIDRRGWYLEVGSVDVPTSILSFGFMRKWWSD